MHRLKYTWIAIPLLALAGLKPVAAQTQTEWLRTWGGENTGVLEDESKAIALDKSGSVYTVGFFNDQTAFDKDNPGNTITPEGSQSAYITKMDAGGKLQWVKTIGGLDATVSATTVAIDGNGDVIIGGGFDNTVNFGTEKEKVEKSSPPGVPYGYIARLNPNNGELKWVKVLGEGAYMMVTSLTIDQQNNIYTTGMFAGNGDFNPGTMVADTFYLSATGIEIFVSKLNASGNFAWAKNFESDAGTILNGGSSITINSAGEVLLTGVFSTKVDFDPGAGTSYLTPTGLASIFVSKLSNQGAFIWARQFDGAKASEGLGASVGYGIATDKDDNIYTTGYMDGPVDFNPGTAPADTFWLRTTGYDSFYLHRSTFLSKLDNAGNFVWAKKMEGYTNGYSEGRWITMDKENNFYITGSYGGDSVNFNTQGGTRILSSEQGLYGIGSRDIFLAKYNSDGAMEWARSYNGEGMWDEGHCVVVDDAGLVFLTGIYELKMTFDPALPESESNGSNDVFLIKLKQDQCWQFHPDTAVVRTDTYLEARADGLDYQWLECKAGSYSLVDQATQKRFVPERSGSFALVVSEGSCADTSDCIAFEVKKLGTEILEGKDKWMVYPNPAADYVYVEAAIPVQINLCDMQGRVLATQNTGGKLSLANCSAGIYFLRISDQEGQLIGLTKIVKN